MPETYERPKRVKSAHELRLDAAATHMESGDESVIHLEGANLQLLISDLSLLLKDHDALHVRVRKSEMNAKSIRVVRDTVIDELKDAGITTFDDATLHPGNWLQGIRKLLRVYADQQGPLKR